MTLPGHNLSVVAIMVGTLLASLVPAQEIPAFEELFDDLSASVEVAGLFDVEATNTNLTFTDVEPGRTTILGEGGFHTMVTARSNYDTPWYLKAHLVTLRHAASSRTLPASSLKWRVVRSTGSAQPIGGPGFHEFSDQPVLMYASQGGDQRGRKVTLELQFSLTCPSSAFWGAYFGEVYFTMEETP